MKESPISGHGEVREQEKFGEAQAMCKDGEKNRSLSDPSFSLLKSEALPFPHCVFFCFRQNGVCVCLHARGELPFSLLSPHFLSGKRVGRCCESPLAIDSEVFVTIRLSFCSRLFFFTAFKDADSVLLCWGVTVCIGAWTRVCVRACYSFSNPLPFHCYPLRSFLFVVASLFLSEWW